MPYRLPFFRKLAAAPELDLLVLHGFEKRETGRPSASADTAFGFPHKEFTYKEWRVGPYTIRWHSGVFGLLKEFDPDSIVIVGESGVATNWLIAFWAKMKSKHLFMWTCGWEAQPTGSFAYRLKRLFMKTYFRLPQCMFVYGTKARDYMVGLGVPASGITVCYNGIDIEPLAGGEEAIRAKALEYRKTHADSNDTIFLYVGGLFAGKRVDVLLRSFAELQKDNNVALWIVGDGPQRKELEQKVQELKIANCRFFGRIFTDVDMYFAASDFLLLPGQGGLALTQAMFWRVPCIAAEADGTEDDLVIEGETGFRFEPGNTDDLLRAMREAIALRSSSEDENMRSRCRALVEEQSNVNRMVSTFRSKLAATTTKVSDARG